MLFFVKGCVKEPEGLSSHDLQNLVQAEIEALQAFKDTGKLIAAYRPFEGQERIGIANMESRDDLDRHLPPYQWHRTLPTVGRDLASNRAVISQF